MLKRSTIASAFYIVALIAMPVALAQENPHASQLGEDGAALYRGIEEEMDVVEAAAMHGLEKRQKPQKRYKVPGALSGKRIVLSPGHGTMVNASTGNWGFQRGITLGLREDIHTLEWVVDYVRPMLERAGATTIMLRGSSYVEPHIVVGPGNEGYKETGTWTKSSAGAYRYADSKTTKDAEVRWSFKLPETADYPVYVRYMSGTNRISDATYSIEHAHGTALVKMDQSSLRVLNSNANGSEITQNTNKSNVEMWHLLGYYPFKAGENYRIVLSNQSSMTGKVVIADAVRIGEGRGEVKNPSGKTSGRLFWEEGALAYMQWLGVPAWVRVNDVSGRALYALYEGADAYLALHTNAFNGNNSGTQTYVWIYNDSNGNQQWPSSNSWPAGYANEHLPPGTYDYALSIHQNMAKYIRKHWDANWSAGNYLMSSNFGELRAIRNAWYSNKTKSPLIIPATLLEVAFHDNKQDVGYISEQRFREIVARGIVVGIIQYFKGAATLLPPLAPQELTAVVKDGKAHIRWEPTKDEVAENSVPTHYGVYTSEDGITFDHAPVLEVTSNEATLDLPLGVTTYVRIVASNAAGASLNSKVLAIRRPKSAEAKRYLFVDGIEREIKYEKDPNNLRSYARIYGPALSFNDSSVGLDSSDLKGFARINAAEYDLVVVALGQNDARYGHLTAAQREKLQQSLAGKTAVLLTGSLIASQMASADSTFLANSLGIQSAAASNKERSAVWNNASIAFGDCSKDAACVDISDVLVASGQGQGILQYSGGQIAAVQSGRAITVGFPLETLSDTTKRVCHIANLASLALGEEVNGECVADAWVEPEPEDPKPEDPDPEDPKPEDPKPEDPDPENPGTPGGEDEEPPVDDDEKPGTDNGADDEEFPTIGIQSGGCTCEVHPHREAPVTGLSLLAMALVGLLVLRRKKGFSHK